jgi:hypothetical protein
VKNTLKKLTFGANNVRGEKIKHEQGDHVYLLHHEQL